jgi:quercetin dioxygenase-like cupin family protein
MLDFSLWTAGGEAVGKAACLMHHPGGRGGFRLALMLAWACSLGHPIMAQTSSAPNFLSAAGKPVMHSRVFQWSDMKGRPSDIATFRNVFDGPTATLEGFSCHVTTLNPGKEPHPPHKHPEEELLVIKEGTLEVMQNGVTNQVAAGGMVFCASNELHGWRNSTKTPVTYYVLKVYPHDLPKAATKEAPSK